MVNKIALVHDWLVKFTGSEKVLLAIYEIFSAPIYTLFKDKFSLKGTILENAEIHTSFLQRIPAIRRYYQNFFPFFPFAIEQFDLSKYDLIISSSHSVAKGILTNPNQIHICYCHTPARYIWLFQKDYLKKMSVLKSAIARIFFHYIRIWDFVSSSRVDHFIANSKNTARRIKKIYGRDAYVIYPPVEVNSFELSLEKEDFYLTVARLVPYKKVDIIVDAFKKLRNKRLIIIGDGPEAREIKKKASSNIKILPFQPFEKLIEYIKKAKAFIYSAEEDFGISMVEAQAAGTPVLAFEKGGAKEIVIDKETGLFFHEQEPEAIIETIQLFEKMDFDPLKLRNNALRFSKERFKKEFQNLVHTLIK